ncbi:dimer_Tnp_hAT domain-containing protein [Trichonephila clavipes]|nr:dimer_Tnp_hAT domain-containing protein [Trichonephila clavipes]
MSHSGPKEELLGLLPLKSQTRGEDIANVVIECMDKHHIPLDKIVSISTDRAKKYDNKEIWRFKFERLCVELEILEKKKCDLSSQVVCFERPGEGRHDPFQRLE